MAKWLDPSDGANFAHVSPLLSGLESFAAACRASLAPEVLAGDAEVPSVLTLLEQGRARDLVWGSERPSRLLGR